MTIPHGTILGGLSIVPDMVKGIEAYRDVMGMELVEDGELPADIAASWGCEASAGRPFAALRPTSGNPCWFRLVEQPDHPDFKPTTTYGWAAFECTVEDVWHWPDALPEHLFEVVGPPKTLENIKPTFIPMQALGPGRELVYFNQVLMDGGDLDLPKAQSPFDKIFIVVLAAPDREASIAWYCERLDLDRGADYTLPYSMINKAFGLPADTQTTISMVAKGALPVVEVDDYPRQTTVRPRHDGMLPPGNAIVTLAVADIDACDVAWIAPPASRQGALYEGRRAACAIGSAGELIECVEVGR